MDILLLHATLKVKPQSTFQNCKDAKKEILSNVISLFFSLVF